MDPTFTLEKEDLALADLQDKVENDPELPKEWHFMRDHPAANILRSPGEGMKMRSTYRQVLENNLLTLILHVEPKNVDEALEDDS